MKLVKPPSTSVDRHVMVNTDHIVTVSHRQVQEDNWRWFRGATWKWGYGVGLTTRSWVEWGRYDSEEEAVAKAHQLARTLQHRPSSISPVKYE